MLQAIDCLQFWEIHFEVYGLQAAIQATYINIPCKSGLQDLIFLKNNKAQQILAEYRGEKKPKSNEVLILKMPEIPSFL